MQTQPRAQNSGFLANDALSAPSRARRRITGARHRCLLRTSSYRPALVGRQGLDRRVPDRSVLYLLHDQLGCYGNLLDHQLNQESEYDKSPAGCTPGVLTGEALGQETKCCKDPSNGMACHKYMDFEEHINSAFLLLAVLPWIAIAVSVFYYGLWWKPMTSIGGFNAFILTVYYAHLIIIVLCCGVVYFWMSESDGYNFRLDATTDASGHVSIHKIPIGENTGRVNAVKNSQYDDWFGAFFILNAIVLAGAWPSRSPALPFWRIPTRNSRRRCTSRRESRIASSARTSRDTRMATSVEAQRYGHALRGSARQGGAAAL